MKGHARVPLFWGVFALPHLHALVEDVGGQSSRALPSPALRHLFLASGADGPESRQRHIIIPIRLYSTDEEQPIRGLIRLTNLLGRRHL